MAVLSGWSSTLHPGGPASPRRTPEAPMEMIRPVPIIPLQSRCHGVAGQEKPAIGLRPTLRDVVPMGGARRRFYPPIAGSTWAGPTLAAGERIVVGDWPGDDAALMPPPPFRCFSPRET